MIGKTRVVKDPSATEVELGPMQIRTFEVAVAGLVGEKQEAVAMQ